MTEGVFLKRRTDLALEVHELNSEQGKDDGIITEEKDYDGIKVTEVNIKKGEGEKLSGKPAGKYITLDVGKIWQYDGERFNNIAVLLSEKISELLPKGEFTALVAGLGNDSIIADAIGPKTVEGIIISHHIKALNKKLYDEIGFGDVAGLIPGVLGQTGVESADIIKSVAEMLKPDCVIVIDALAARRLSRLATTVQLSDSGISPGSGVSNSRAPLTSALLNAEVISIGVPTVVDTATLVYDLFEEVMLSEGKSGARLDEKSLSRALKANSHNFFITPKETDIIIKSSAKLLSTALNLALHKNIPLEDIAEYV